MYMYMRTTPSCIYNLILIALMIKKQLSLQSNNALMSYIIHLMYALEGNSEFCFPENLNVSRDEVEGNIEIRGKTKFTISRGSIH